MAINIPTTQDQKDTNLSNLESELNQESPLNDKAFQRVLAAMEAMAFTQLYKLGVERALQNFALTATGEDLERIGQEFKVIRRAAEAAVLEIEVTGTNGTTIPATTAFIGDSNGIRYFPDAPATISGGTATLNVTAQDPGVAGNLNNGETLSFETQVPGADNTATVTDTINIGAEEEEKEVYRQRVLNAERATTGGGNATDYKVWSEEVAGVKRAYPFAGKPFDDIETSFPGDRTVYIEADATIDPDGIAPVALLNEVREALNFDPATGLSRPPLGLIDDTLFVESIIRTTFDVEVTNLDVPSDILAQVESDIEDGLTLYFSNLNPFVEGIDAAFDRNDTITTAIVSNVVADVVTAVGGSVESVTFEESGQSPVDLYLLDPNELAKLGTVSYVA